MDKIKDVYEKHKRYEEYPNDLVKLIMDCYRYEIFKDTKATKQWFKQAFETDYPEYVEDLSNSLKAELKQTVKARKKEAEFKEKMKRQRAERGYSDSDAWNIYSWFLEVMPKALKTMRKDLHGCPVRTTPLGIEASRSQAVQMPDEEKSPEMIEWEKTLDRMIFLLEEMNDETCSMKNPYQKEYDKANDKFQKKYGFFGKDFEKINNIESDDSHGKRVYFIDDDPDHPEWAELSRNYFNYEKTISMYRDRCREEFFHLFSYWFWDLWD